MIISPRICFHTVVWKYSSSKYLLMSVMFMRGGESRVSRPASVCQHVGLGLNINDHLLVTQLMLPLTGPNHE